MAGPRLESSGSRGPRFSRRTLPAAVIALAAAIAPGLATSCQSNAEPPGQLMVGIHSDMSIPKDVDVVGIRISVRGRMVYASEQAVGPDEVLIPATLNVLGGKDPSVPVTIQVWSRQGALVRTLRQVVTTVPENRVASLRMPIQWLCTGTADEAAECEEGDYCISTTCGEGRSCVAGSCIPDEVESESLPDFEEQDVFGGATAPGEAGKCLDTVPCFAGGAAAPVDSGDCSLAAPSDGEGTNVALVLPPGSSGVCSPEACLVPLDAESEVGWRTEGERILLPPSVCTKIANGEIAGVAVTTSCETKTEGVPLCGPWSSVTSNPGSTEGPPPANVVFPDAGPSRDDCSGLADGTPCGDPTDGECDGADACLAGECVDNLTAAGEPCGDASETECSAPDSCDGAGSCLPNDVADGTACDDCAAGAGSCSTCSGGKCASACRPGSPAPPAVLVTAPDSTAYSMDATEVTNAQYCAFLAAEVPPQATGAGRPECAWNDTYLPGALVEPGSEDYPVAFVDWCDAVAYCEWKGQRLCGAVGGGSNGFGDYADPALSQWQNACSNGGTLTYSFGTVYDGVACNGQDNGAGATVAVGSLATCEGGIPGLFDLSGNVFEWEDSCDATTGATDNCRVRGGSYLNPGVNLACGNGSQAARENQTATVGFRCCD